MIKGRQISEIKETLDRLVGSKVRLETNFGRNKVRTQIGILEETYPNIFTIKLEPQNNNSLRLSYSYSDILVENIHLSLFNEEEKK